MKIAAYKLQDGNDPRQIIVFKREHLEESGKKDVRFLVWDRHNPKFGISDANYSQVAGISVHENKKLIQTFLGNIIRKGEAKTCYQYLGATEEVPEGFITEVIPIICETKKYDPSTVNEIKKIKDFIDTL
ncbi:MAG: hypothetical protein NTW30_02435 [Candidatus Aenigmarchaeota archaeon]|nr:hypothetical protein [Candidatus Aenigmarchaeota archaeon]